MLFSFAFFAAIYFLPMAFGSDLWLEIVKTTNSKRICYLINESTDELVSNIVDELFVIDIGGYAYNAKEELFKHCEITDRTVLAIDEQSQDIVRSILETASQAQLRNNLWIIRSSNATDDNTIQALVSNVKRKLGLRVLIFFLDGDTLQLTQLLGTATEQLKLTVVFCVGLLRTLK